MARLFYQLLLLLASGAVASTPHFGKCPDVRPSIPSIDLTQYIGDGIWFEWGHHGGVSAGNCQFQSVTYQATGQYAGSIHSEWQLLPKDAWNDRVEYLSCDPTPAESAFDGVFTDSAHPGCTRSVSTSNGITSISGTDPDQAKDTDACDGVTDQTWGPRTAALFSHAPGQQSRLGTSAIQADFSFKGGPEALWGTLSVAGGIDWSDGNTWVKLPSVTAETAPRCANCTMFSSGQPGVEYTILDVDYSSYAIAYSCTNTNVSHHPMLWVMIRDNNPSAELLARIKDVIDTYPNLDVRYSDLDTGIMAVDRTACCPLYRELEEFTSAIFDAQCPAVPTTELKRGAESSHYGAEWAAVLVAFVILGVAVMAVGVVVVIRNRWNNKCRLDVVLEEEAIVIPSKNGLSGSSSGYSTVVRGEEHDIL